MLSVHSKAQNGPLFLVIHDDGHVVAYNGHVDLGTGIRTSLAQIVAEELDVAFDSVEMVLGNTVSGLDQGATIASETIQVTAIPLRQAAATARQFLANRARTVLGIEGEELKIEDGVISCANERNVAISYGELVGGLDEHLEYDPNVSLKRVEDYSLVGKSKPRVDIPLKAVGAWTFVHDVRIPGMLHGRVIRPPYGGFDHGDNVGASFVSIDETSVSHIEGLVAVVVLGDFVGVVATREENAIAAMDALKVEWLAPTRRPDLNRPEMALRANPATARQLIDRGNVDLALQGTPAAMNRTYVWPYQMHGSIGPSCAVAHFSGDSLTVWSGTQNPYPMRRDLALLMDVAEEQIVVERFEAAGCYGRNCADDVTADAALLSRAVGAPVRVQLTRDQEHAWEPKGAAQIMDVRGGLDTDGGPAAYDFETRYPSNLAPTLALILTGKIAPVPDVAQMGDRTAIPPYAYGNLRVTVYDMPPIARASWLRGVSAMPNTFAHECYIDELAAAAQVDPIEYRLRYLPDERASELVRAVAERAKWQPHTSWGSLGGEGDLLYGRGFAYAVYVHGKFPGTAAAWAAWVADVAVNKKTGEIAITKVTCGQDAGLMINPDGVRHQIHGNVIQSASRVLKEKVEFSDTSVLSKEWGGYPIITFPEVPEIDVLMLDRPNDPPLGVGESASVPSAAAIANAVYDATGVRFRELPLTPEAVLAGLGNLGPKQPEGPPRSRKWRRFSLGTAGAAALFGGLLQLASPWQQNIATISRPEPGVFSASTIERGRLAAAAGACNVCHVSGDGQAFGGGRRLETPFGDIYASNISPDVATGIGGWSYPAFERAMRRGVSRDGHHLYPAHPYTSFAGAEDADLQALYAYLMSQPPIEAKISETKLAFPYNIRPLMAGWNALFHRGREMQYTPERDAVWNRGAYLVETLGHCSACHSPRNTFGAEMSGKAHLAGGFADGWHAPALNGSGNTPVQWTEAALYDYLRKGSSAHHGSALGPMGDVVRALEPLHDQDIKAMAAYLASLSAETVATTPDKQADEAIAKAETSKQAALAVAPRGQRIFEGACATCHSDNRALSSLALNTNLHAPTPDNVIQTILGGAEAPSEMKMRNSPETMSMPAFGPTLSDSAIEDLVAYLRARFAPDEPAWSDVAGSLARARSSNH